MINLVRAKEIRAGVDNEVGALARMMSFLVNHGINVETVAGYSDPDGRRQGSIIFITADNRKSIDKLIDNGYTDIEEHDVIVAELENRPGSLKNLSEILASNKININYFYCTTCSSGCSAKVVFSTSDNDEAFRLLNATRGT